MAMTINELINKKGEEVSKEFISGILSNLKLSRHSIKEMRERTSFVNLVVDREETFNDGTHMVDFRATMRNIRNAVDGYVLAYINTDGSINVALSDYDYFVFAYDENEDKWILVTFKEKSWYDKSIREKQKMAKAGFARKLNK